MMLNFFKYILISICIVVNAAFCTNPDKKTIDEAHIVVFLNRLFSDISEDIFEIEGKANRIAIYNIKMDRSAFSLQLSNYIEGRLHQIFQEAAGITLVNLPRLNGIKISSSDTSFQIVNTVPSLTELWKIGRNLNVEAFLEGECSYIPQLGVALNLRISKTGSASILWAKTYTVYAEDVIPEKYPPPTTFFLNLGLETFHLNYDKNDIIKQNFNGMLTYHTLDFGIMQYIESQRHFRYEVRLGIAFLNNGIPLNSDQFKENTFYGEVTRRNRFPAPVSFRFQTLLYTGLIAKETAEYSDWLSLYISFIRNFAEKTPDFNCVGVGLRSDISENFSLSTGLSFVLANEFNSIPLKNSDQLLKLNLNGLQYHLMLIQYAF